MARRKEGFFWASFTDLMTSLFFVMLVLYVLTYLLLKDQQDKYIADAKAYERIKEIETAVEDLAETGNFIYQNEYKRHILKETVEFEKDSPVIRPKYYSKLAEIGKEIEALINIRYDDVKYLVIIEGMASKEGEEGHNYRLSYARAYSLYKFWAEKAGINFDPEISEVLISGSGEGGVGRDDDDKKNRRFLIQIIPKISTD